MCMASRVQYAQIPSFTCIAVPYCFDKVLECADDDVLARPLLNLQ
jgi:hypothetical protein